MNFLVFSFSLLFLSLQASTQNQPVFKEVEKSIWEVCSSKNCATGFFIDANTFITNLHVINKASLDFRLNVRYPISLGDFSLQQKESQQKLEFESVQFLSLPHDFIALKTKQRVKHYLPLNTDKNPKYEELNFFFYANGEFKRAYQYGKILYGNDFIYKFIALFSSGSLEYDFEGGSGSPMLNNKGEVVGIVSNAISNLLKVQKVTHLNNMLQDNELDPISYIKGEGKNINECLLLHKRTLIESINEKLKKPEDLTESEKKSLGFYLNSLAERELGREIRQRRYNLISPSIDKPTAPSYLPFLNKAMRLNDKASILLHAYLVLFGEIKDPQNKRDAYKKEIYKLSLELNAVSILESYIRKFYKSETEEQKKKMERLLRESAKTRYYPSESLLKELGFNPFSDTIIQSKCRIHF